MSVLAHSGEQASSEPGKHITDVRSYLDTMPLGEKPSDDTHGSTVTMPCAHGHVSQSPAEKGKKKRRVTPGSRGRASATEIALWGAAGPL